ncbi:MAG: hypothetical protein ACLT3H_04860 [Roseburia sp.]
MERLNSENAVDKGSGGQMEDAGEQNGGVDPENSSGVDYDLTDMNSDMIYVAVYQMMIDPDAYVGKTFRMSGLYDAECYEPAGQYYHYCIIEDVAAFCAQGTFETYREEGSDNLYCRLKGAVLGVGGM